MKERLLPSLNLTWVWRLVSHGSHTCSVQDMLIVGFDLWYNGSKGYRNVCCSLGQLRQIVLDGPRYPKNHFFIKGPYLLPSCGVTNVGNEPQLCSRTSITCPGCLGLRHTSGSEGASWIWPLPFSLGSTSCEFDTISRVLSFALEENALKLCVSQSFWVRSGGYGRTAHTALVCKDLP